MILAHLRSLCFCGFSELIHIQDQFGHDMTITHTICNSYSSHTLDY